MSHQPNNDALDLTNLSIFADVPPDVLELVTNDMVKHFRHDQPIFRHGDDEKSLVVLLEGQACVYRGGVFLKCRTAPAVIGEQALIDDTTRSATLIAQGFVKALVLPEAVARQLLTDSAFTRNLLRICSC